MRLNTPIEYGVNKKAIKKGYAIRFVWSVQSGVDVVAGGVDGHVHAVLGDGVHRVVDGRDWRSYAKQARPVHAGMQGEVVASMATEPDPYPSRGPAKAAPQGLVQTV